MCIVIMICSIWIIYSSNCLCKLVQILCTLYSQFTSFNIYNQQGDRTLCNSRIDIKPGRVKCVHLFSPEKPSIIVSCTKDAEKSLQGNKSEAQVEDCWHTWKFSTLVSHCMGGSTVLHTHLCYIKMIIAVSLWDISDYVENCQSADQL